MFTKLTFFYDRLGLVRDKPLELLASDVRGQSFYLLTASYRCEGGDYPAIHICRTPPVNPKDDAYNEDGRPPDVWTTIVLPHVTFNGRPSVELFGFERPNMAWAGHPRPAYSCCKPLDVPQELLWPAETDSRRYSPADAPRELSNLPRQRVWLSISAGVGLKSKRGKR